MAGLRNIEVGEEFFADYDAKLMFYEVNVASLFEESEMKSEKSKYIAD